MRVPPSTGRLRLGVTLSTWSRHACRIAIGAKRLFSVGFAKREWFHDNRGRCLCCVLSKGFLPMLGICVFMKKTKGMKEWKVGLKTESSWRKRRKTQNKKQDRQEKRKKNMCCTWYYSKFVFFLVFFLRPLQCFLSNNHSPHWWLREKKQRRLKAR